MDNEQLDIKLKAKLSEAVNEFGKLTSSANNFNNVITTTIKKIDSLGKQKITNIVKSLDGATQYIEVLDDNLDKVSSSFKSTTKPAQTLGSTLKNVFSVNKLYLYWNLTKRIRTGISNMVKSAIDYLETENKFGASMGNAQPQATRFINRMTEAIGIARTELMEYMSTYKNILSGLGNFTDIQAEKISESLTRMALDYSSLFNVSTGDAMNKFQSALTGSIRPIRSDSGFDVSDTTIGAKAEELGVERSVGQLNQMEKRLLRIIVLMDQMKRTGAFGDLAKTIEQPANQLKVLKAQLQEVGMWLGAVFTNTLGKILPYINAFVMTIKELIKMFALFVGYEGASGMGEAFEVAADGAGAISAGVGSAAKKAKELKKTLMGFDVLNVISTPKDTDSSGGGGVGSIDPKILGALEEYDSLMEKVKMKATEIRDKIMDWLGFTQIINPETEEISWKLKEGYTNLEKIRDVILLIISFGLVKKVYSIVAGIAQVAGTFTTLGTAIANLGLTGFAATLAQIGIFISGVIVSVLGVFTTIKGVMEIIQGEILVGIMDVLAGIAMTVAGIALLFGAWPIALGAAIVAAVALIIRTIADNWEAIKKFFEDIWSKFDEKVIKPIKEFVSAIANTVWNLAIKPIIDFFVPLIEAIVAIAATILKNIKEILAGAINAIVAIITKVIEIGLKIVEIIVTLGKAAWEYIIKPILSFFGDLAMFVWNNALKPIINFFIDLWNRVNEKFIQPLISAFKNIGIKIADFIGGAIKAVINGVLGIIENTINGFIRLLNGAIDIINKIPNVNITKVSELSIPRMADGGLPNVGEMFVAREAGPELVGKIGNSNAVMNNQQIVSAVSQGVASAVSSVLGNNNGNRPIQLILNGREIAYATRDGEQRLQNIFGTA